VFVQAIRRQVPWMLALPFAINLIAKLTLFSLRRLFGGCSPM
jgi:hypothetical protein